MKKYKLPEFGKALRRMSDQMRGDTLSKAALAGGLIIEGAAKVNAKATFNQLTGNLAAGISTTIVRSDKNSAVAAVGPSAVYGRIQELGGVIKPVRAKRLHWVDEEGQHHTAMAVTLPARPYLRPAADENEDQIMQAIAVTLRREIEGSI